MNIQEFKEFVTKKLDKIALENEQYKEHIEAEIIHYYPKITEGTLIDFYSDFLFSNQRHFFTITSKDTFSSFEHATSGETFIYTPLNDHSRGYMHKGDVVFCYRQGQFESLEDALNIRGIYALGFVLSDPMLIFPEKEKHNQWGVAIVLPIILHQHLELKNIQMHPTTINLTPYNGNRNDALQYIPDRNHYETLLSLIIEKNSELRDSLQTLLNAEIVHQLLPELLWQNNTSVITDNSRETLKKEFKFFLENIARSSRRTDDGFNLKPTAVFSYLLYLEANKLFDYNPGKWAHVYSVYDITTPSEIDNLSKELFEDADFIDRDKIDAQGYRSGALMHYVSFIKARSRYMQQVLLPQNVANNARFARNCAHASHEYGPLQKIVYGAPGTGKSHGTDGKLKEIYPIEDELNSNSFRTTFHPDSDYSTFVGAYKPTMKRIRKTVVIGQDEKPVKALDDNSEDVETIVYTFVPQSFTEAYCRSIELLGDKKPVFLIIEEINRGNCAQIFGDIFQLLDRDDNGWSKYAIKPDNDLENYLVKKLGDKYDRNKGMTLPPNLYIWATMNTSDQSLFPIDSAFKRRWDWEYVPIEDHPEKGYKIVIGDSQYPWYGFLEEMNKRIYKATDSEDKEMGYFFIKLNDGETEICEDMMVNKVLFYLFNDVFKSYDGGDLFKSETGKDLHFSDFHKKDDRTKLLKDLMTKLEVKALKTYIGPEAEQ